MRSFDVPPMFWLLGHMALGFRKGLMELAEDLGADNVGEFGKAIDTMKSVVAFSMAQVEEIANTKMPDLNANTLEAAARIIEGSARAMGIDVVG